MIKISPSILSADFANLERDIRRIGTADYVHVDVMDGLFVPNITIGIPVVKAIRPTTDPEHTLRCLELGHGKGKRAGVVLKPGTPAEAALPFLSQCDILLVMTVEPGFGGQAFMADMMPKLRQIRQWIDEQNPGCELEVDGGIDPVTCRTAIASGANVLVAGSAVYKAADIPQRIKELRG